MTTYIGQPADQYRFIPPHPQARILPSDSSPAVLPAERANFDSQLGGTRYYTQYIEHRNERNNAIRW